MALISVIIPTYNRAAYLKTAIESVLAQDFQDFEIVITDNASTDHTEEVVAAFKDHRIRYIKNHENLGVVPNHNLAIKNSRGEFIHFFSDDDIMHPANLRMKYDALSDGSSLFVHGNIEVIDSNGIIVRDGHWASDFVSDFEKVSDYSQKDNFDRLFRDWNFISMPSVMFHKSLTDQIGYLDKAYKFCPDWDYWLRASLITKFTYVQFKSVQYRVHASNTIADAGMLQMINEVDAMRKYLLKEYTEHPFLRHETINDVFLIKEQQVKRFVKKTDSAIRKTTPLSLVKFRIKRIFQGR